MSDTMLEELKKRAEASKTLPKGSDMFKEDMKAFRKKNKLNSLKRFF